MQALTHGIYQNAHGNISMTIDGWSVDMTKASFLGVTGHWIDVQGSTWKLRSAVLAFHCLSGQHSGANIARTFYSLCQRIGVFTRKDHKVSVHMALATDRMNNCSLSCIVSRRTILQAMTRHVNISKSSFDAEINAGHTPKIVSRVCTAHLRRLVCSDFFLDVLRTSLIWQLWTSCRTSQGSPQLKMQPLFGSLIPSWRETES